MYNHVLFLGLNMFQFSSMFLPQPLTQKWHGQLRALQNHGERILHAFRNSLLTRNTKKHEGKWSFCTSLAWCHMLWFLLSTSWNCPEILTSSAYFYNFISLEISHTCLTLVYTCTNNCVPFVLWCFHMLSALGLHRSSCLTVWPEEGITGMNDKDE